ncbi:MAG TPA: hypothetical protein VIY48_18190 [Candidatus Paceibacterota bacterium]
MAQVLHLASLEPRRGLQYDWTVGPIVNGGITNGMNHEKLSEFWLTHNPSNADQIQPKRNAIIPLILFYCAGIMFLLILTFRP